MAYLTPKGIQKLAEELAGQSDEQVEAAIKDRGIGMADAGLLVSAITGVRAKAAKPAQSPGSEVPDILATVGLGAGVTGAVGAVAIVSRVKDLLEGKQMRYEAFLNLEELAGRLRTLMGERYRIVRLGSDAIAMIALADNARLCEIRFSPEDNAAATSVTVSRPDTEMAKDTAADVADEALRGLARPGSFGGLGGLLDMGKRVVSAVVDTAGKLSELNAAVGAVEAYGKEIEQALEDARKKAEEALAEQKAEEAERARKAEEKEYAATHCQYCKVPIAKGSDKCPQGHPQA